ncbi:MAG: hypothetical protein V7K32_04110 [Nostoc sp.]|uniref:hypothetical protein n=1 Tax=Nostoc sp. TaxID=1180 RepID=UPI002FF9AEBF
MSLYYPSAIARRFFTQSAEAGLGAARCGNFQLQLTTSLASFWKSEVGSWKLPKLNYDRLRWAGTSSRCR